MVVSIARLRQWNAGERKNIQAKIDELRPWHYSFDFGDGLTTRQGQNALGKFDKVVKWLPENLEGASCLDCPSNNGQLSMLLKDRNAGTVVGRDIAIEFVRQGEYIKELLGYDIDFGLRDVYSLASDPSCAGGFDYVFSLGLIYHLTDMFGALRQLAALTKQVCFIETMVLRIEDHDPNTALFIEGRYASDDTNWWVPGVQCVIGMGRAVGFKTVELIDYYEPTGARITREGYRIQPRAIFRATKGGPTNAQRLTLHQ